jgi:DNA (cytosine-5)-methyltransferase 3A
MNVLSLFDGISAGQLALKRAGINVTNYFSSEIDKYAIQTTQYNFPNTIQLGSVETIDLEGLPKIDLLLAGSPCQGFSTSGKQLGFDDPRSRLFYEFVKVLKKIKPTYFLLENVVMKKDFIKIIDESVGVQPVLINSNLVSAQNRKRNYWTNFPIREIEDKKIYLDSVLEEFGNPSIISSDGKDGKRWIQSLRVNSGKKSNTLTSEGFAKLGVSTMQPGKYVDFYNNRYMKNWHFRPYTAKEYALLQNFDISYFNLSEYRIKKLLGNSWTVDLIAEILKNI